MSDRVSLIFRTRIIDVFQFLEIKFMNLTLLRDCYKLSAYNSETHSEDQKKHDAADSECDVGQLDLINIFKHFVQIVYNIN